MAKYPFEVDYGELRHNIDSYVDSIFGSLESEFLVMPRGAGFVDYSEFESAFQLLKRVTRGFIALDPQAVLSALPENALVLIVLRTMLGFTPPEWAYVTSRETAVIVSQGYVRSLDRRIRMSQGSGLRTITREIEALVVAACKILAAGAPELEPDKIHRLAKADTKKGLESIRHFADLGAPYALVLYERFLGRPFAGHRDSVSELIGGRLETRLFPRICGQLNFRLSDAGGSWPGTGSRLRAEVGCSSKRTQEPPAGSGFNLLLSSQPNKAKRHLGDEGASLTCGLTLDPGRGAGERHRHRCEGTADGG